MHWTTEPRGTPPLRVGNDVGVDVGNDVGVKPPWPRVARAGPAGLRSLPAKQHAPKARPSPATDRGRRGVVPGRPSRTNGCAVRSCAAAGSRTFALDRRTSPPQLHHEPSGDPGGQQAGGRHPWAVSVKLIAMLPSPSPRPPLASPVHSMVGYVVVGSPTPCPIRSSRV